MTSRRPGRLTRRFLALAVAAVSLGAPTARALADRYEAGIAALDQGRWSEALPIYLAITRENPAYAWGWLGLGWSLHYTGDCRAAIPAYRRAIELGAERRYRMRLEIARCLAALGQPDSALHELDSALTAGLPDPQRLARDGRLASLHGDPRFRSLAGLLDTTGITRERGWRHDLTLLGREIRRMHVAPFRALSEAELERRIAGMIDSIGSLDDDALAVRVMALSAALGDGHTAAEPRWMQEGREEALPILIGEFDDGVFVTGAAPDHADLLWARVVAVEGVPVGDVLRRIAPLLPRDNPMRLRSIGPRHLRHPRLLRALGLARSANRLVIEIEDRRGRKRRVTLAPRRGAAPTWVRKPSDHRSELPIYARRRADWYWFEPLNDTTLYVQYNACADKDSESVADFSRRLLAFVDRHDVRRMVVDLRYNGGGDLTRNRPLLEAIVQSRKVNQRGRLFVIVSRHTFSAAMSFAAQLERFTHALFAGEPTGSSPNFVGETNLFTLPWSGIQVSLSNLAWQNALAMDQRIWIAPRIPVPWTFASYRDGRDPVLEAILAFDDESAEGAPGSP